MAIDKKIHKEDIEKLISQMTLEEKAALVNGATFFGMGGVDRLGIPALMLLDGGTGMNFEQLFGDFYSKEEVAAESTNGMVGSSALVRVIDNYYHPERLNEAELEVYEWIKERLLSLTKEEYSPGCFPPGILLGATFDPDIVYKTGVALGKEASLFGINILLGSPNVNIHRDPLNGRLFEGYSEDPYLVSRLAPELVKGVQEMGVAANVKHFAANNQETNRVGINETISARALREIYLPGFKACVTEGQAKTVMSAYNAINGTPCSENKWLLTELLRGEWGFDGAVVSDWGAVYHPVEAITAGNDLAMPGPISGKPLVDAVREGRLDEETLNLAVRRLLSIISFCTSGDTSIDTKDYAALRSETTNIAYEAAISGIVLLKNKDNLYPLKNCDKPILITGSGAEELMMCGTGSAGITTDRTSDLADTLRRGLSSSDVTVCPLSEFADNRTEYIAKNCGTHVVYVAKVSGMEGNDRPDMFLSPDDRACLDKLCDLKETSNFTITLILNTCGPIDFSRYEEKLDAIFVCFLPGMEGAHALGDLMLGKRCPSGKLPLTFPRRYEDTPTFLNFPGEGKEVNYGEGIYVGYRYYDKKKIRPAYPFGFGLSYTTFELFDLTLDSDIFEKELCGHVTVKNTGEREGAQVVQIYISDPISTLPKPEKELKFFAKVDLKPGEQKTIDFTLSESDFASFDPTYNMWLAEEGSYDIIAAASSSPDDEWQRCTVYLKNHNQYSYGLHTTVKVMYENAQLKEHLSRLWSDNGWDWQIVGSNYQYTPNKELQEIFPTQPSKNSIDDFIRGISTVKH